MIDRFVVWLTKFVLKRNLSIESKNSLTNAILSQIEALPIASSIEVNSENEILIGGKPIDIEKAKQLRSFAQGTLRNQALQICREQVLYTAIILGVHKAESEKQMYFAKAAIWYHQELEKHLRLLAQEEQEVV